MQTVFSDFAKIKQFPRQGDFFFSLYITIQVMAVTDVSPRHKDAVAPLF